MKVMHPFKSYRLETKSVTTEDMIPMRRPCFAGDTKMLTTGVLHANRTKRGRNVVHKLFKDKKNHLYN